MDAYTATALAYNNGYQQGYEQGKKDAVKHGKWEKHTTIHGFVYCSACKDVYLDKEWLADGKWGYCPNCGALMDGGNEDG